jgi:cellulose synthase operon protein C
MVTRRSPGSGRKRRRAWVGLFTLLLSHVAAGQQKAIVPPAFSLSEPAQRAISQPFLTDDEKKDLRVFHGVWDPRDLDTTARAARAAALEWRPDDPAFADPALPKLQQAEMALQRGLAEDAIAHVDGDMSVAADRLRAESLLLLNRVDEAIAAAEAGIAKVKLEESDSAADIVDAVRCRIVLHALRKPGEEEDDHLMAALGRAHQELDRLYWPAKLVEAQILIEKSNREEGLRALYEVLSLNPRCAPAWAMMGQLVLDVFDFASVDVAAAAIERLNPSHPLAARLRALAALAQNDPAKAEEILAPVLVSEPKWRGGLELAAAIEASRYDEAGLQQALARHEALSPGSPHAYFAAGQMLSMQRQYEWSAEILQEAIRRRPTWPAPWIELGLLQLQAARDDAAREALTQALDLDRYNKRAVNSMFLLEELSTFEVIESKHFRIRFKPGIDKVVAALMPDALDAMHEVVASRFGHEPDRKTMIELMPDHQFFSVRITGMPWIHTVAACTGPLIAMEVPREGPPQKHLGPYDWLRVLQHEYTHTITLSQTQNRIPHWLTEAAAVSMELAPRNYNTCLMLARELETGGLFTLDTINWGFIRPQRPQDRGLAYAQGHWMVEFMNERFGEDALVRLLEQYHRGVREDLAMPAVLDMSRDQFMREFLPWAQGQVRSWGLGATPTIIELTDRLRRDDPSLAPLTMAAEHARLQAVADALTDQIGAPSSGSEKPLKASQWPPLKRPPVEITDANLDDWLAEFPDHPDLVELRLRRALGDGEPDPTLVPLIERYASLRPVDPYPHRLLARIHLAGAEPQRAIPHLAELDARADKDDAFALELARLHRAAGRFAEALTFALKAARVRPYSATNRELAAAIALEAGNFTEARRHIEALTLLEPDRPQHRKRLEAVERRIGG